MKELTKGKRWVGSFENEFVKLLILQNDEDNSIGHSFAYGGGFHSEGYYMDKKITNQKEAFSVLCHMGATALKTIDWTAIWHIQFPQSYPNLPLIPQTNHECGDWLIILLPIIY